MPAVSVDARPRTFGVDVDRLMIAGIVPLVDLRLRWIPPGAAGDFWGAPCERSSAIPKGEGTASATLAKEDCVLRSNAMLEFPTAACERMEDAPAKVDLPPCLSPSFNVVPAAMYCAPKNLRLRSPAAPKENTWHLHASRAVLAVTGRWGRCVTQSMRWCENEERRKWTGRSRQQAASGGSESTDV